MKKLIVLMLLLATATVVYAQAIDCQLVVTQNDKVLNGSVKIAIQVKGSNLGVGNTMNGATFDIQFDTTKLYTPTSLAAVSGITAWNAGITSAAYTRSASRIVNSGITYIRIGPVGNNVNANFDGTPAGWDVTSSYQTVATVTFKIKDISALVDFTVRVATYAFTLFADYNNNDGSGNFTSPTLNPAGNIVALEVPVELTTFTASANRLAARLSWATASEVNNAGFDVERKALSGAGSNWEKVGFVAGAGNSNTTREYGFVENDLAPGRYAYRLKQIDNDGTYKYSQTTELEIGLVARMLTLADNYPNPFNPSTKIEFTVPEDGNVSLKVFNVLGQEVATLFEGVAMAGRIIQTRFDASNVSTGLYFAKLQFNNSVLMKKMIFAK